MAVLWVVAPCRLVWVYRRFRGPYCLMTHRPDDGGITYICNVGRLIPVYTELKTQKTAIFLSYISASQINHGPRCQSAFTHRPGDEKSCIYWYVYLFLLNLTTLPVDQTVQNVPSKSTTTNNSLILTYKNVLNKIYTVSIEVQIKRQHINLGIVMKLSRSLFNGTLLTF
jgi:hypothetical protein